MRTYRVLYMVGARCIYETKLKAANKYDCKALASKQSLPTLEQYDNILIFPIKNKGDHCK